jgi:hypothetical protein
MKLVENNLSKKVWTNTRSRKPQSPTKNLLAKVREFANSRTFNVCLLLFLIVSVFIVGQLFRARRSPVQLSFVERKSTAENPTDDATNGVAGPQEIFSGEVYDTAVRLRETGALGIAISLGLFAETAEAGTVPANLETLWASVQRRGLLPPDIRIQDGLVSSPSSTFSVRYQPQPLRFEILSCPKQGMTSPALMFRFPLPVTNGNAIHYFQSSIARRLKVPEPFTSAELLVASGWTLEEWRGELLPRDERILRMLSEEKRVWSDQRKR